MKPELETFINSCPDIDEKILREHLSRLDDRYFKSFSQKDLFRHVRCVARLSADNPVEILLEARKDGSVDCTVIAFDYPSVFSIISGLLAGSGYSILSGDVFTYRHAAVTSSRNIHKKRIRPRRSTQDPIERRKIIDHFSGLVETSLSFKDWGTRFGNDLQEVFFLLDRGDEKATSKARHHVNEMVVKRLARFHSGGLPALLPVRIDIDNKSASYTRLKVVSEDTPAFLYALTNALSLHDILIEHVRIRTIHGRIEDKIDLVDSRSRVIEDPVTLDRIKLSVLLTKQFTYFLGSAPDPYAALSRFEQIVGDILRMPQKGKWIELLTNPRTLQNLAQLLGASNFLWEDFIRLQYETLLPMLKPHVEGRRFSGLAETLKERLEKALGEADSLEAKRLKLNEFKDREIFLIDLDYILHPDMNLRKFSEELTWLAENVVNTATRLVYDQLVKRFGKPRTVAGLEPELAILGLGKLGGKALGYASDIEVLFVYSDNGKTDGENSLSNAEFFERLVRDVTKFILAKREGIFHMDMRLRPYGSAGPMACSLENFCRYYGQGGPAHSYERLALVRLRAVGGDRSLGARLERLRDEMLYSTRNIDLHALHDLRKKQYREKKEKGRLNAKFSPGGLVDLEYGVQILQVIHGRDSRKSRTPRLHEALKALADMGVLSLEGSIRLSAAYDFLRLMINGMRMLRGSAKDLFLPPVDSNEFGHLARRMGYVRGDALDPGQRLHIDFEAHTATVRTFLERHFGRDSLPGFQVGTVADLVLSDSVPKDLRTQILENAGFRDPERAYLNLKGLAGRGSCREIFAKLAVLAFDILLRKPDPDMALNNWERFIHSLSSPEFHYKVLLSQPMRLEILLSIFSSSQFLADTLVRNPGFLDWVIVPETLHKGCNRQEIEDELKKALSASHSHGEWLNKIRRLRRREILRTGTRDIFFGISTRKVMRELSALAEALTQAALDSVWESLEKDGKLPEEINEVRNRFCIMALGKLGGNELNYSSDIDLLGVFFNPDIQGGKKDNKNIPKELFAGVMEKVSSDLSMHTEEGYAYRVDLRLRPFGRSGELVTSITGVIDYALKKASLWEIQASLKMRPIAGNLRLGYDLIRGLRPILQEPRKPDDIVTSIEKMREEAVKMSSPAVSSSLDVKSGLGGLRDVEFLVQGLQLIHAPQNEAFLGGNTLNALEALSDAGILPEKVSMQLKEDYIFLRRTEHYLQLMEDRQVHVLPRSSTEINALSKRVLGVEGSGDMFMAQLNECLTRIHNAFLSYLVVRSGSTVQSYAVTSQ